MRLRAFFNLVLLISAVVVAFTSVSPLWAREVTVPIFEGIIFADGRPIEKAIAVRLEAENSSEIATTYTSGSGKFLFRNIQVVFEDSYILVVRESGYRELRHRVESGYFVQDSATPQLAHSSGSVILDLVSLPPEKKARRTGPKAVDARQLKAEISEEARHQYGQALKKVADGNSKGAMEHLKKAVELSPEYYDALARLGLEYMRAGQPDEARGILERAQALNPNDPIPLTNLGIIQFEEGEKLQSAAADTAYRRAVELFEKAVRLNPLAPRANLYLGIAFYKLGAYDKSEPLLINTLVLDSRMHEARLTLINIYSRQHRYDAALIQISEYLQANPNAPQRKELEELRGRIQGALGQP